MMKLWTTVKKRLRFSRYERPKNSLTFGGTCGFYQLGNLSTFRFVIVFWQSEYTVTYHILTEIKPLDVSEDF